MPTVPVEAIDIAVVAPLAVAPVDPALYMLKLMPDEPVPVLTPEAMLRVAPFLSVPLAVVVCNVVARLPKLPVPPVTVPVSEMVSAVVAALPAWPWDESVQRSRSARPTKPLAQLTSG